VYLGMKYTAAELAQTLRALKQACATPTQSEPRKSLVTLLEFWTEDNADVEADPDPAKVYLGWFQMFDWYYPAELVRLKASRATDAGIGRRRWTAVNGSRGNPAAGQRVFEQRACNRCHAVSGHLGPDLKGAVSRMSRDDLFTAMIDPNLEVSPAY